MEIPAIECSPPPFQKDNIKYEVGERVTTVINLLDWDEDDNVGQGVDGQGASPLATSMGWVDVDTNYGVTVDKEINGVKVTSNGLPMSEDFDLAVYIKGDRKPTAIYNAYLEISYEDPGVDVPIEQEADLELLETGVTTSTERALGSRKRPEFYLGEEVLIFWKVRNNGPDGKSNECINRI